VTGRAAIEADQLAKLRRLLAEIIPANPFYTAKLGNTQIASLDDFFERAPFTFKHELVQDQCDHAPFGSNLTYPLERYTRFCQTSGTTGSPMHWLDTPETWAWMLDSWDRVYRAAAVTAGDRIFFAFSFGPFLGFWTAFESAARIGCMCIPGGGMRSGARLRTLIDAAATVLCCTPTYAIRLGETAAEEKIDLSAAKIRTIIVSGEPGGAIPATRSRIEQLWNGAHVVDHHGMTETGPVSYGCPARQGVLHIIEPAYIAEVIDSELVLTNLGRTGSPLLRYRTSDVVHPAAESPCACGSYEMALEGGILGRTDDMVVVRGVNVYPSAVENILRAAGGVAEYRVEIHTLHALPELRIQVEASADHAQRIQTALNNAFALRIPVSSVPAGTLPRFEMKAKRWVRL
jgi:phenylacetate-CoA ligase